MVLSGGFSVSFIHTSNTQLLNTIPPADVACCVILLTQCMVLKVKTKTLDTD